MSVEQNISSICHFKCECCGADLTFAPGTEKISCSYCANQQTISSGNGDFFVTETDLIEFLKDNHATSENTVQIHTIKCVNCGAMTTFNENVTSDKCAFCGTAVVVPDFQTASIVKPKYILPFGIDKTKAQSAFIGWIKKLIFAPGELKKTASQNEKLIGVYIPYWTYDCNTETLYKGARGVKRKESSTESVNGKRVNETRTVVDWCKVSGKVKENFDDVLVNASLSLPAKYVTRLEPWDLNQLVEYDEKFLSGFRTESYQIDIRQGFENARKIMDDKICTAIRCDIGGDEQKIYSHESKFSNITFKHILLPIWISVYRYKNKVYRFMVNGRTGEVQGERPWSRAKILLASLGGLAALLIMFTVQSGTSLWYALVKSFFPFLPF